MAQQKVGTFYLRFTNRTLVAMVAIHVDDLALASTDDVRDQMKVLFDKRFGTTKLQKGKFQHTGRYYEQHTDGSISTSLCTFIKAAKPEIINNNSMDLFHINISRAKTLYYNRIITSISKPGIFTIE